MKLGSIKVLCAMSVVAWLALMTGCTNDGGAVDSDQQGLRGGAVQGWSGDGGDGRGHFGTRGDYDSDADGGTDEHDCHRGWRRGSGDGFGDHDGFGDGFGDSDDDDDDKDGWDGRR